MPPRSVTKTMQLRLPLELHAAIKAAAHEDGRSASSWVIRQLASQLYHRDRLRAEGKL